MKRRGRVRNAAKARNSFVTRRAEIKIGTLADMLKSAAAGHWTETIRSTLRRELHFTGLPYLDTLRLIYNWENRFLSVNYNLQMLSIVPIDSSRYTDVGGCRFKLNCSQKSLKGKRSFSWEALRWEAEDDMLKEYIERLSNPLITDRLQALDIMEMDIWHDEGADTWKISVESLIGSATWILIPPVLSMITPKKEECIMLLELFELLGDAVCNNK